MEFFSIELFEGALVEYNEGNQYLIGKLQQDMDRVDFSLIKKKNSTSCNESGWGNKKTILEDIKNGKSKILKLPRLLGATIKIDNLWVVESSDKVVKFKNDTSLWSFNDTVRNMREGIWTLVSINYQEADQVPHQLNDDYLIF